MRITSNHASGNIEEVNTTGDSLSTLMSLTNLYNLATRCFVETSQKTIVSLAQLIKQNHSGLSFVEPALSA